MGLVFVGPVYLIYPYASCSARGVSGLPAPAAAKPRAAPRVHRISVVLGGRSQPQRLDRAIWSLGTTRFKRSHRVPRTRTRERHVRSERKAICARPWVPADVLEAESRPLPGATEGDV